MLSVWIVGGLVVLALLALGWLVLQVQLLKGALAAYQAHRPGRSLELSRRCLALHPVAALRPVAFQVLGLAYSALGERSEAERCFRSAMLAPDPANQARSAVLLAGLAHRDGRLDEARELLLRGSEDPTLRRDARVGLVELALDQGDLDRARLELQGAHTTLPLPEPARELESRGLLKLLGALVEIEDNRPAAARALLDEAAPAVASIPMLAFRVEVARELVAAMEHRASALPGVKAVDARLSVCGEDKTARLAAEMLIARGYVFSQAFQDAERVLRAVLVSDPPKVVLPELHVLLADCALARGDEEAARRSLEDALRPGVETRNARLARSRLAELEREHSRAWR